MAITQDAITKDPPTTAAAEITVLASGTSSIAANTGETDVLSYSAAVGTFSVSDFIYIDVLIYPSGNVSTGKIRLTVGGTNCDQSIETNVNAANWCRTMITSDVTNTMANTETLKNQEGTLTAVHSHFVGLAADWIAGALSVAIRCSTGAATTMNVWWKVYRLRTL